MRMRSWRVATVVAAVLLALVPSVAQGETEPDAPQPAPDQPGVGDPSPEPPATVATVPDEIPETEEPPPAGSPPAEPVPDAGAREAVPARVRLVEIGRELGFPQRTHSWDLVVGHVDGDDIADLVIADHSRVQVWLNRHRRLEPGAAFDLPDPHGCALGDVDGNGLADLYCTTGGGRGSLRRHNRLFLQEPEGTWTRQTADFGVADPYGRGRRTTFIDLDRRHGLDLFAGNEPGRSDGHVSANRTFLQREDGTMRARRLGPIGNKGAACVQAVDYDRDGWQDLLLCGGSNQAGAPTGRLHLFRNVRAPGGGRRLVDVAPRLGIALNQVRSAHLARLNGDRFRDLVVVGSRMVTVWPGNRNGGFDPPAFSRHLRAGNWVAVGNVDGRRGQDLFIVQGCTRSGNTRDILLLHRRGFRYDEVLSPLARRGCGDTAAMIDLDGDGADEVVVGNGRWASRGPMQVFTAGPWRGRQTPPPPDAPPPPESIPPAEWEHGPGG